MLKETQLDSSNLFWEKSHSSSSGSLDFLSIGRHCGKYLTLINLHWQKTEVRDLHGFNNTHSHNLENNHWMHIIFQVYSYYSCQKKKSQSLIWETIQKPALNGVHIWILYDSGYRENVMCWQIRKVCNSFLSQNHIQTFSRISKRATLKPKWKGFQRKRRWIWFLSIEVCQRSRNITQSI